jgi:hypothetical protein
MSDVSRETSDTEPPAWWVDALLAEAFPVCSLEEVMPQPEPARRNEARHAYPVPYTPPQWQAAPAPRPSWTRRIRRAAGWLLVAALLTGCSGGLFWIAAVARSVPPATPAPTPGVAVPMPTPYPGGWRYASE